MPPVRGWASIKQALSSLRTRSWDGDAPDDLGRADERLGISTHRRPEGPLIWVHADTADGTGWMTVLKRALEAERGEDVALLLTTRRAEAAAPLTTHQIVPNDTTRAATAFLDHWRPNLAIFVNAPAPQALMDVAARHEIPLLLTGMRGSGAERKAAPKGLERIDRALATSASDADRLRRLGIPSEKIEVAGALADMSEPLDGDPALQEEIHRGIAGRPLWLAAHVAPDELDAVEAAQREAGLSSHRLLLILSPENSDRDALAGNLAERGWRVEVQASPKPIDEAVQIVVAAPEDLGLWYRIAPITFVGGTLMGSGAADPFEPALLGSAVLHGPYHAPFEARFRRLREAGATLELGGPETFPDALRILFAPDRAAEVAHAGWSVTSEAAPVVDRLVELANAVLDGEGLR